MNKEKTLSGEISWNLQGKLPWELPWEKPTGASIEERSVRLTDFGAVPDGKTLNTEAFAAAIRTLAEHGGGRLICPEGVWLTGPIHLQSGVELHLEKDCEIRFSQEKELYLPPVYTVYEGVRCYTYSAMLYAERCHDIAVTGEGTLNGQGHAWWYMSANRDGVRDLYAAAEAHRPVEERVYTMEEDGIRPGLLLFLDCQNVLIEGVTFMFSPFWTVHPTWCENVWIRNITVRNPYLYAPNTDGVNLEGCRRALVEGVYADTGDDAICIKSGRDEDGRLVGRPCEQVLIRRCRANRCHGGITIGSETSGGVRDIRVEDCELMNARFGLWIKTAPERGNVIENIEVRRLKAHCIEYIALCMTMGYYTDGNEPADVPNMPTVRHILVEDVSCESAPLGVEINGYPEHPIQDVTLRHLFLCAEQGMRVNHATALTMEDVHFLNE